MALVIAEAGENHCGDMDMALKLIEISAKSGADFVKFQMYDAAKTSLEDEEREWFHKVQVSEQMWLDLVAHSKTHGIKPLCTPWNAEKAEIIFRSGVNDMKIASFHTTNLELLSYVNERASRVFLSTGMSSIEEVDKAVATLNNVDELYLLHCVSEYPLPIEHVNLRVMDTLKERYAHRAQIGYSDHTLGIMTAVAAVSRGAEVIEKHITLGHDLPGTDHILSADPVELPEMVRQIRLIETILGEPEKRLTEMETDYQEFLRGRFENPAI